MFKCWVWLWLLTVPFLAASQWATNTKLWGLSSHINEDVFLHIGAELDQDYYITDQVMLRGAVGIYEDSYRLFAGFVHFGVRVEALKFHNMRIRVGLGPTFIFRENWWNHKPGYDGSTFFGKNRRSGAWETALIWYGGDIELEWVTSPNSSLLLTIVPGYPVVINTSLGIRWRY